MLGTGTNWPDVALVRNGTIYFCTLYGTVPYFCYGSRSGMGAQVSPRLAGTSVSRAFVPCRKAHDPFPREVRCSLDERPSSGLHESGIRDYGNRRLAYDRLLLHKRGLNSEIRCSGTAPGTNARGWNTV
jgi:hypothetical protein